MNTILSFYALLAVFMLITISENTSEPILSLLNDNRPYSCRSNFTCSINSKWRAQINITDPNNRLSLVEIKIQPVISPYFLAIYDGAIRGSIKNNGTLPFTLSNQLESNSTILDFGADCCNQNINILVPDSQNFTANYTFTSNFKFKDAVSSRSMVLLNDTRKSDCNLTNCSSAQFWKAMINFTANRGISSLKFVADSKQRPSFFFIEKTAYNSTAYNSTIINGPGFHNFQLGLDGNEVEMMSIGGDCCTQYINVSLLDQIGLQEHFQVTPISNITPIPNTTPGNSQNSMPTCSVFMWFISVFIARLCLFRF